MRLQWYKKECEFLTTERGKTRGPGGPWDFLKYWLIAKVCFVSLSFACLNHQYLNGWHQRLWILAKGAGGGPGDFLSCWLIAKVKKSKSQLGSSLSSKAMTDRLTKDCPKGFFLSQYIGLSQILYHDLGDKEKIKHDCGSNIFAFISQYLLTPWLWVVYKGEREGAGNALGISQITRWLWMSCVKNISQK